MQRPEAFNEGHSWWRREFAELFERARALGYLKPNEFRDPDSTKDGGDIAVIDVSLGDGVAQEFSFRQLYEGSPWVMFNVKVEKLDENWSAIRAAAT